MGSDHENKVERHRNAPILCFATKGAGSNDEARIVRLLSNFPRLSVYRFDRRQKLRSAVRLLRKIHRERPRIVVMEGTGLAGGLAVLLSRALLRVPYVVSSGDAVGPILGLLRPWAGRPGLMYERRLCRNAAGFIGWTPYLVGRAVTLGAPRAMTAANWTLFPKPAASRDEMRERLGFPPDSVVFGLVGAVIWTDPPAYAYGLELVQALRRTDRDDVRVLVVGDGSGLKHLQEAAAEELGTRVILTGAVPHAQVLEYMSAMDVASLPQSTDEIGALRYTSKLSEYISARLPIVTGQIPLAYDLDTGWMWRLPGIGPWDERYVGALAMIMKHLTPEAIAQRRATIPADLREFDGEAQRHRVTAFMTDLLDEVLRST